MKPAAKTIERALEVLTILGAKNGTFRILYSTGRCACGETKQLLAYHAGTLVAAVTICEQCGDDTLTDKELTKIY